MAITNAAILYPVRFTALPLTVRVTISTVTEDLTFGPPTIGRNYWVAGDAVADDSTGQGDLLKMLETCLETHTSSGGVSVYIDDGVVEILHISGNLQIHWDNVGTTLDPTIFGWTAAAPSGNSTVVNAPNAPQGRWNPGRFISKDTRNQQTIVGSVSRSITGLVRTARLALPAKERELMFELLPKSKTLDEYAVSTAPYNTAETMWRDGLSLGRPVRLYENEANIALGSAYFDVYKTTNLENPIRQRTSNLNYFDVSLSLVEVE